MGRVSDRFTKIALPGGRVSQAVFVFGIIAAVALLSGFATVQAASDPLVHNSENVGTKYGTWGALYDCNTCHTNSSDNIKLSSETIKTPIGDRTVVFNTITSSVENSGILGDDLRTANVNGSKYICEVCHHRTVHHQYSSGKITDRTLNPHQNRKDCTKCHPHGSAFKSPSCDSCHGDPPVTAQSGAGGLLSPATGATSPASPGAHQQHVTTRGITCNTCHNGSTMLTESNTLQLGFAINGSNWPGFRGNLSYGSFSGHAPLNAPYGASGPVAGSSGTIVKNTASYRNSCNVYCHGNWAGSNGSINPSWVVTDGSQKACGTCHAVSQAKPPTAGSHARHTGTGAGQMNLVCSECHGTLPTDTKHLNGLVQTRLNTANSKFGASATYKGFANQSSPAFSYGACANTYCHGTASTSTWGAVPLACNGCHSAKANDTYWTANSAHRFHWEGNDLPTSYTMTPGNASGDATTYRFACSSCHSQAGGTVHLGGPKNAGAAAEIYFGYSSANRRGSYSYGTTQGSTDNGFSWSNGGSTCNTTYCHSDGKGGNGLAVVSWRTTISSTNTRCALCHGYTTASGIRINTGRHSLHADRPCTLCHYVTAGGAGLNNKSYHINKRKDVNIDPAYGAGSGGVYDQYSRSCSSLVVGCHYGGPTLAW